MKARRHLRSATDAGDPVLGYEAAIPHLTLPPGRGAPAGRRSRGLVTSPLVLGAMLGLGTTSFVLLALLT